MDSREAEAVMFPPIRMSSSSMVCMLRCFVLLNAMRSTRCATPALWMFWCREPAFTSMPTVAICPYEFSEHTRRPLLNVVSFVLLSSWATPDAGKAAAPDADDSDDASGRKAIDFAGALG